MSKCGPKEGNGLTPKSRVSGGAFCPVAQKTAGRTGAGVSPGCLSFAVTSFGREQPRDQSCRLVPAAVCSACVSGLRRREEEEAAGAVLQGADAGVGAPLPAAALPVGARARAAGAPAAPHSHAGQNLVPEPSLQAEARPRARGLGVAGPGSV